MTRSPFNSDAKIFVPTDSVMQDRDALLVWWAVQGSLYLAWVMVTCAATVPLSMFLVSVVLTRGGRDDAAPELNVDDVDPT